MSDTTAKPRWKWHELALLACLASLAALSFLTCTTAVAENEWRAVWISGLFTLAVVSLGALGVLHRRRGSFESKRARRVLQGALALVVVFVVSLVVPSDSSFPDKRVQGHARPGQVYDATKQPGNEIFAKIDDGLTDKAEDVLTFSIYDVCMGKVSHRVRRDGPASPQRVDIVDAAALTGRVKEEARALGADLVGVAPLDPKFVFQKDNDGRPVHLNHRFAIVLGKGLDYRLSNPTAPLPWADYYSAIPDDVAAALSGANVRTGVKIPEATLEEYRETLEFFADGGKIAVQLAEFIRSLGYPARAHFGRWSEVQVIPLAVQAGLGEVGRNGMLLTPELGPRGSFPVVTTDLPLVPDEQRDHGIQEFCRACTKCSRACPVEAVPYGEAAKVAGLRRWQVDGDKCWTYLKVNPKCMACTGSCPFNKADFFVHRLANVLIARRSVVANRVLAQLDDLLGYGRGAFRLKEEFKRATVEKSASGRRP